MREFDNSTGNDVSMIQEAQLGVGIKGREGAQAARAADFALVPISLFSFYFCSISSCISVSQSPTLFLSLLVIPPSLCFISSLPLSVVLASYFYFLLIELNLPAAIFSFRTTIVDPWKIFPPQKH